MSDKQAKLILTAENADYKKKLKEAETATEGLEKSIKKSSETAKETYVSFDKLGKYLGGMAVAIAGVSIRSFADFDLQMKKVKAISGATADEFDLLKNKARELGANTSFTAVQAGEAFESLARMGVTVKEQMKMTNGVLALAEGQMISLSKSAEIVNTTLITFQKQGINATNVVDMLTTASNNSNNSVETLAGALKAGGVVASEAGVSMNETIAVFMKMAEAGKKSEEAGTALRNILINMISPNTDAKNAFSSLGIEIFNSEGKMRNFFDIINEMKTGFKGLTQEQADNYAIAIAGRENYTAFKALMSETGTALEQYKAKLDEATGSAKKQIDEMQGLSKNWDIFESTVSETGLIIGGFLESDGNDILKWATDLVNLFNTEVIPSFQAFGEALGEGIFNIGIGTGNIKPDEYMNKVQLGQGYQRSLLGNLRQNEAYPGQAKDYYADFVSGKVTNEANLFWKQMMLEMEENNRLLQESNSIEKKKMKM
jgi:TP901 family phage tail tape measure protein